LPARERMRVRTESASGCRLVAPRLWLAFACLPGCSTEVGIFRALESATAGAAAIPTASSNSANSSNDTDVLLTPRSSAPNPDGSCQPGHYVGDFNGMYNSAAWGNGSSPLSIAATPAMGRPGLEFWLEAIPHNCRSDEEFCADFTVRGGKIRGYANPFSAPNMPDDGNSDGPTLAIRLEIDFGGNLDCSRGKFRGLLQNGCYDVATILFRFEGTAPADYDPATSSFTNGMWMVTELPSADAWFPPDSNIGGMGSWQASLANDVEGPAAEGGGLCDE
jgi:hypothetical protein